VKKWGPTPFRAWLQAQIFERNIISKPGIKSLKDLEGKIICIGPRAVPIPEIIFNTLADIHGVDAKKVRVVKWDRPTEAYDGFKAGRFDAIGVPGFYPTALTTELLLSHPGHILHVDDAQMAKLQKQLLWVLPLTIPPGTYKGMDKTVQTPAIAMFLVTHRDMPESFVYAMTKMVWDHFDEFSTFHPTCKKFSPADVTKVVDTCPYHSGAIKYYRETGVWTKELDQRQAATLVSLPPSVR
jgi:TRAP transporter TAXI family solute receptor